MPRTFTDLQSFIMKVILCVHLKSEFKKNQGIKVIIEIGCIQSE